MTKHCDDWKDRKGCGREIKVLRFEKDGQTKYETVDPVKFATFDRDGNLEMRFIPHWLVCGEQRARYEEYVEKQMEKNAQFAAERANGGGGFRPNNGGGYNKGNGGGYRGNSGGGRGYQGRAGGGGGGFRPVSNQNRQPGDEG